MNRFLLSCAIALSLWAGVAFSQEPIRIGFVFLMSGRTAAFGVVAKQGAQVALDEINKAGGVSGRRLVGIFRDSEGNKDKASAVFRDLVEKDKVNVVIGR